MDLSIFMHHFTSRIKLNQAPLHFFAAFLYSFHLLRFFFSSSQTLNTPCALRIPFIGVQSSPFPHTKTTPLSLAPVVAVAWVQVTNRYVVPSSQWMKKLPYHAWLFVYAPVLWRLQHAGWYIAMNISTKWYYEIKLPSSSRPHTGPAYPRSCQRDL